MNIGAEDEFGHLFNDGDVLNEKQPINFATAHPTQMRYLDPSFYLHNLGIQIIVDRQLSPGYHITPQDVDHDILEKWSRFYNEDLQPMLQSM